MNASTAPYSATCGNRRSSSNQKTVAPPPRSSMRCFGLRSRPLRIKQAVPSVHEAFAAVRPTLGTAGEAEATERLYCGLPSVDFSRRVLSAVSADVYWNDLGDPDRVVATWRHLLKDAIHKIMPAKIPAP